MQSFEKTVALRPAHLGFSVLNPSLVAGTTRKNDGKGNHKIRARCPIE